MTVCSPGIKGDTQEVQMTEAYRTVYRSGTGEIEEKKSRFIASVSLAESEEEAQAFIESVRKKYWDARHNCWAFVTGPDHGIMRCSDDGEPQGTAGRPMLDVLTGEKLYNICVVVTRYFGGTLLGTGGLVRAYSRAVQEGLKNSLLIEKKAGRRVRVCCDYNTMGKVQYQAAQNGIALLDTQYADTVEMVLLVPEREIDYVTKLLTEATNARASLYVESPVWFAAVEKEILLFDH